MKKITLITALIICSIFTTANLFSRTIVVSIQGEAAYRDERAGRWIPLEIGVEIADGVRLSTGVKSSLTLNLSGNTVVMGSLTMMLVQENQLVSGTQRTTVNMRRGEIVADVTKGDRVRTVFRVQTTRVTSAVRGTKHKVETGPSGTVIQVTEGSVKVSSRNGQTRILSEGLAFNKPKGSMEPRPLVTNSVPSVSATGLVEREQVAEELFQDTSRPDLQIDSVIGEGRINVDIFKN